MKYLSEFLWTHSLDVFTLVPDKSKFLTLIANISVLPGFNLLHLNTIVSLVGHLLRPLVLFVIFETKHNNVQKKAQNIIWLLMKNKTRGLRRCPTREIIVLRCNKLNPETTEIF